MSVYPYFNGGYVATYSGYPSHAQPYAPVVYSGPSAAMRLPTGRPPCLVHDACTCGRSMAPAPKHVSWDRKLVSLPSKRNAKIKPLKKEIATIESVIPRSSDKIKRLLYQDLADVQYELRRLEAGY